MDSLKFCLSFSGVIVMPKFFKSLLLATGLAACLNAGAATYTIPGILTTDTDFGAKVGVGAFSDIFDFTLAGTTNLGSAVYSLEVILGSKITNNIAGLNMTLYSGPDLLGSTLGSGTNFTVPGIVPGGSYSALVTGVGTGTLGGKFGGTIGVTPVPEPSTWGMLLVGLGLLGYAVARKKA